MRDKVVRNRNKSRYLSGLAVCVC